MRPSAYLAAAFVFVIPSRALTNPARPLRAFDARRAPALSDTELMAIFDGRAQFKEPPFVIDIPAVVPAPYERTFKRLRGRPQTNGYDDLIRSYAAQKKLDPRLIKSVIAAESEFTTRAKSPAGALGLMQVMPETAGSMGVSGRSLFNPEANIRAGTAYLAYLFEHAWKRYHLKGVAFTRAPGWLIQRIVAAYNAGPRFLARHRLYRQTRDYVRKVLLFYRSSVTDLTAAV
ncbi:MAG: lytic transglycosylase domain-containing protein [Elusimicrobiota bacterium]